MARDVNMELQSVVSDLPTTLKMCIWLDWKKNVHDFLTPRI